MIQYFGEVKSITKVKRKKLFPNESKNSKSDKFYYKIELMLLEKLDYPIISLRARRIVFIPTTIKKFFQAKEINALFHGSILEDNLWSEFKQTGLEAERQFLVSDKKINYFLDFALFCKNSKLNIECNGDKWHINREKAKKDNQRDNFLNKNGWTILRYSTQQLSYINDCINEIKESVNKCGGLISINNQIRYFELRNRLNSNQSELF